MSLIHPVILSGGSGTRLWPLSRQDRPKQFLALAGDEPMIVATARRVADPARFAAPMMIAGAAHADLVAQAAAAMPTRPGLTVLEPTGRNTAGPVALALRLIERQDPQGLALILPSDHTIAHEAGLLHSTDLAARAARTGRPMTFGIVPTAPETGYGYIECGQELDGLPDAFAIKRFVEKPDLPRAQAYLASGDFFWNSGMFLLPVAATLEAYRRHAPAVLSAVDAALGQCSSEGDTVHPDAGLYAAIPAEPFDTAIMENLDNAGVVPSDIGWSDVGSWQSLWQVAAKDPAHNATRGSVLGFDNEGCYLRSDGRLLMAFGLRGIAVIDSDDAIAVFPRRDHQRVREAVEHLRSRGRAEADRSVGSAVATITLNAGEALTAPPAGTPAGGYWYLKRGSVEVEGAGRTHPKRLEAGKCAPMAWSGSGTIRAVGDGPVLLLSFGPDPSVADD